MKAGEIWKNKDNYILIQYKSEDDKWIVAPFCAKENIDEFLKIARTRKLIRWAGVEVDRSFIVKNFKKVAEY